MSLSDVVTSDDLLGPNGPAWFTEVLERAGLAQGAHVTAVSGRAIGTGQVGESVRFDLTWSHTSNPTETTRPSTVVGKFPSSDATSRATARMVHTYEIEVSFYTHLHSQVSLPTPTPLHAAIVDDTGDFTLIMSDVAGATQGDQLGGCGLGEAQLMAAAAARLHGPTLGADTRFDHVTWLNRPDVAVVSDRQMLYQMLLPGFLDRYRQRLGDEVCEVVTWLSTNLVNVFQAYLALNLPVSVVHGDYRLDNMLFHYDDHHLATHVTVVDWQTAGVGSGAADLAYGIGSGLPTALRRQHERALFDAYCDELAAYLPTGTTFDRNAWWQAYRLGSCSGLAMAVTASMIVGRTDRGDEMFCVMAERHAQQMTDLGVSGLV
jgi:hypothetical protein